MNTCLGKFANQNQVEIFMCKQLSESTKRVKTIHNKCIFCTWVPTRQIGINIVKLNMNQIRVEVDNHFYEEKKNVI